MRKGNVTHPSDEVQGTGSFVVVKPLTWGEMKNHGFLKPDDKDKNRVKLEQAEKLFVHCIVDWNWTDTEGVAIKLPRQDPSVVNDFTDEEVAFLLQSIMGNKVEITKKKTG